jgi:hypothetical protein
LSYTDKDDVGSDYYESDDLSRLTLGFDGMDCCDSDVGIVDLFPKVMVGDSSKQEDLVSILELPLHSDDELVQVDDVDLHYLPLSSTFESPKSTAEKFKRNFIDGNVVLAAYVLVSQAAFQSPHIMIKILPLPHIMLFLYLAKLIISSGVLKQYNLSKVLSILYTYDDKCQEDWAPIPCTISGFRSLILNFSLKFVGVYPAYSKSCYSPRWAWLYTLP